MNKQSNCTSLLGLNKCMKVRVNLIGGSEVHCCSNEKVWLNQALLSNSLFGLSREKVSCSADFTAAATRSITEGLNQVLH